MISETGVWFEEPPDDEPLVSVHLVLDAGATLKHVLPYSSAVALYKAYRSFKLTKRGRIVGIVSNGGYLGFDLQCFSAIEVKVKDPARFGKQVEA